LVDKYFNAETTLDEEAIVKEYFAQDTVASDLKIYQYIFRLTNVQSYKGLKSSDVSATIVNKLIEKYFQAESTMEEEAIIKEYFAQDEVTPSMLIYKSLFRLINIDTYKGVKSDKPIFNIIDNLIEKYFKAETSLDEENLLRHYFAQEQLSVEHRPYRIYFDVVSRAMKVEYNGDLELKNKTKIIPMQPIGDTGKVIKMNWWKTAAAAVLVTAGGYLVTKNYIINNDHNKQYVEVKSNKIEPQTPEEAYEITVQALALVSKKYNKGQDEILEGMKSLNKATDLSF
jgi:hypothetical protein